MDDAMLATLYVLPLVLIVALAAGLSDLIEWIINRRRQP